jgi:hypothetical protein
MINKITRERGGKEILTRKKGRWEERNKGREKERRKERRKGRKKKKERK